MIALLFCLTSFTGCLGGDDLEQIEEMQEEETIEPVGENDLSNLSKELEALKAEVDQFLADYEALQGKVNDNHKSIDLNASEVQQLTNQFDDLNKRLELLENDHHDFEEHVHEELDNLSAEIDHINQILYQEQLVDLKKFIVPINVKISFTVFVNNIQKSYLKTIIFLWNS